jgi:hypothetical protein
MLMHDAKTIAEDYIAFWNVAEPAKRREMFDYGWRPEASYADPLMRGVGREEIGGLVDGAQARFPGFRFRLKGLPDGHGEFVRFSWELGPEGVAAPIEGSDVLRLRDGRIAEVIGFLDKVPV